MISFSRQDAASVSHLTGNQLEYLIKEGVLIPDEGEVRKRLSRTEVSLAIICGCAIQNGIKPSALKEPIGWLRRGMPSNFTDVIAPENPLDRYVQCYVERFARIYNEPNTEAEAKNSLVEVIAGMLAANSYKASILEDDFDGSDFLNNELPKMVDKDSLKERSSYFMGQAEKRLSNPYGWDIETVFSIENALRLHFSISGDKSCFLNLAVDEEGSWQIKISSRISSLEGRFGWLTIDLKALFIARPITG